MPLLRRAFPASVVAAPLALLLATTDVASAQLYDNGPIATGPRAAGGQLSVVQTALGLITFGWGTNGAIAPPTGPIRVADNFLIPDGHSWDVTSLRFFTYQTGSTTTSTITGVTLRIWNGRPGDVGSTIVFGDAVTNRLSATAFTNIYRVTDTDQTNATRPIMSVDANTTGLTLGAGTYWADWSLTGSLGSGPWTPPVTRLGQTVTAANGGARQFIDGAWRDVRDDGAGAFAQDLPFQVFGSRVTTPPPGQVVPEPSTYALLATGLVGLALAARRRR